MRPSRGIRGDGSITSSGLGHRRRAVLVAVAGAIAICTVGAAGAAGATAKQTSSAGFEAQSFAATSADSAGGAVTGQKPESKLWYAQGSWWAAMVVPTSGAHDIYQLVAGNWVDTGVQIDSESTTREDVLWDGTHLYVLSRTPTTSEPNRLRRFSFVHGAYQLDSGFPVNVPGGGAEASTIAEDSTGTLWLTYASNPPTPKVMVAHSVGNDQTWTAAFALPMSPASGLKGDDISAIISFTDATGPAIGVAWDNENLQSDFFAIHRDGAPDTTWSVETTLSGTLQADDHMNLKTYNGSVYIAVKTATTTSTDPLIKLLVRSPTGTWSQYPVAPYSDHNTRPVVIINTSTRDLYIFMSKGDNPAHGIYYKETSLDNISFPSTATPFIVGPNNETINNGTSMKQNVDATTGIVVMASDDANYWWNGIGVGGAPPNSPPTANDENANVSEGTATPITLSGSDAETCQLGFTIVQPPTHGGLGSVSGLPCTAGTPNTDTAMVTYTPTSGYVGSDSFTYQVTDAGGLTDTGTVTITVSGSQNSPPTAANVSATTSAGAPVTVTMSGSDAETCQLGFAIVQPPTHGGLGSVSGQPCTAGTPNTDTATATYTPTSGYVGADSFTYRVTDGGGLTATATATITVSGVQTTAAPTSYKITTGTAAGGGLSSLVASDNVYLSIASTTTKPRKTEWWGAFSGVPSNVSTLSVSVETNSTASCTQTVQIRDWTTSSWVSLDSRTLGSTDTVVSGLVPPGSLSDYIDSSGAVEVLVGCSSQTTGYTFNADQLALTYGN
jgi:hypothetical protein